MLATQMENKIVKCTLPLPLILLRPPLIERYNTVGIYNMCEQILGSDFNQIVFCMYQTLSRSSHYTTEIKLIRRETNICASNFPR
jgi:hypothetical protein